MSDHRIHLRMRPRAADEPTWLSPLPDGPMDDIVKAAATRSATYVMSCADDGIAVYRDLSEQWVHWKPGTDPAKSSRQSSENVLTERPRLL